MYFISLLNKVSGFILFILQAIKKPLLSLTVNSRRAVHKKDSTGEGRSTPETVCESYASTVGKKMQRWRSEKVLFLRKKEKALCFIMFIYRVHNRCVPDKNEHRQDIQLPYFKHTFA